MARPIDLIPSSVKLTLAISYDLFALTLAFFSAYIIRLGIADVTFSSAELFSFAITTVTAISLFYFTGVYSSVVRYFNAKNTVQLLFLLLFTSIVSSITGFIFDAFVPRSIPIIFFVLSFFLVAGARALVGLASEKHWLEEREGVVIYGATSTGRQLAETLMNGQKYQPLAFIDQKSRFHGRTLNGLKTYNPNDLGKLVKKHGQFKVLLALSNVEPARVHDIIAKLEPFALELLTIPSMSDIVSGKRKIDELREVSVDELLGREAVTPIPELLAENIYQKVVMVSGAGGSIGKELCRQIIGQKPTKLILLDVSEAFLYEINQELTEYLSENSISIPLVALIGNVQNGMLMTRIFNQHKVQTIYHAAAYKHVPMVENNVIAGITNNIIGTYEIAQAAVFCEVETFVLISTDKAVRPTNVMGATKRMAELVLQGLAKRDHNTRFVMVRFGNVLGSSGSVVPLFKKQIKAGGPITVTHPDIIRYFMTIPEAAQLVVQAGAMGKGGDVFLLDMGEPVKIVDLAYKMTHLMGLTVKDDQNPDGEIAIEFSGLRPGEKLYEELLIDDNAQATYHQRILTANEQSISWMEVSRILLRLTEAMEEEDISKIKQLLMDAPLGYQPKSNAQPQHDEAAERKQAAERDEAAKIAENEEKLKAISSFSSNVVAFQQP